MTTSASPSVSATSPAPPASVQCYALHPQAAWRTVGSEVFVVTHDRAFHRLREPSAVDLMRAIAAGQVREPELVALLLRNYAVDAATAAADVSQFLHILTERHIAVATPVAPPGTEPA